MCVKLQTEGTGTNNGESVFDINSNCSFTKPEMKNCDMNTRVLTEK